MLRYRYICAIFFALAIPLSAQAANPFADVSDFNAVIFGNATASGGDTEGRLAVGGNLTCTNSYGVAGKTGDDGSKYSLIVGGNLTLPSSGWDIGNYRKEVYGGNLIANSGLSWMTSKLINESNVLDFQSIYNNANSLSKYLSGLATNGTISDNIYNAITLTGNTPGTNLYVFNVNADYWSKFTDRYIYITPGSTAVINIIGDLSVTGGTMYVNGNSSTSANSQNVLFNFYDTKNISTSNFNFLGSILAPDALLTINGGEIEGQVLAGSSNQLNGGEFHNVTFTGNIPPVSVPEPSSILLGLLGFIPVIWKRFK